MGTRGGETRDMGKEHRSDIIGETQSCYCGKSRLQKVLNKRVPLTVANVF